ncbi:anti-sigma factor antagonist [Actinokineospora enzanensis]|uniref:anti-sigma factor antagonist n=1 Tax=Actinokineospora enzanensis TaxID=155975 RepID=UPI0003714001|nr:anti-sigma factor antagonist [Actinokineospora enzanensis]
MAPRTWTPATVPEIPLPRGARDPGAAVRVTRAGRWAALARVRGEVDLSTAPAVERALASVLAGPDLLVLVVDLSEVDFMAAAGLTALVHTREQARVRAVDLRLVATTRAVLRPLDITGLRQTFRVHADTRVLLAPHVRA